MPAFAIWAALLAAGSLALQAERAEAAGDGPGSLVFLSAPLTAHSGDDHTLRFAETPLDSTPEAKPNALGWLAATPLASRRPVCVRLCDGYFFPLDGLGGASEADACSDLCPDAPTAVYFQKSGSGAMEEAISAAGERYTALAAAFRYRSRREAACACHATAAHTPYWRDPTLRAGDAVMTASGFMVYRGSSGSVFSRGDFTELADAPMAPDRRAELTAIERVSASVAPAAEHAQIAAATPSVRAGGANAIRFVHAIAAAN